MTLPTITETEHANQQLSLPEIEGVETARLQLIERLQAIGETAVSQLVERYQNDNFSFADICKFAEGRGRNRAEAGKIFTRFYNRVKEEGLEPPRNRPAQKYEKNRDQYAYPLSLLTFVLDKSSVERNEADIYDDLLQEFYTSRLELLLVKKSTST